MPGVIVGDPWGDHHLCSPLRTASAQGVSLGFAPLWVFIGSLTAKPEALGSGHASQHPLILPDLTI